MKTRILVLGTTGMLGHAIFKHFSAKAGYEIFGTVRSTGKVSTIFTPDEQKFLINGIEAANFDSLIEAFAIAKPDIVINCIGIIKQSPDAANYYNSININSFLPHRIARLCAINNARMIHISTDCVFDGKTGSYLESDNSNATDLYGKSKFLGEVDYPHAITIRTSIIGHELYSKISLVDWFLSQKASVSGYTNAVFTGFTTYELANIIQIYVLPNPKLSGLHHVSADKISKHDLLKLIAQIYKKETDIVPNSDIHIDRSLNSDRFRNITGFKPIPWREMIRDMHSEFISHSYYQAR